MQGIGGWFGSVFRMSVKIDPKLIRSNDDIKSAVNLWCDNESAALVKYGHISDWDTSRVTNMSSLFREKNSFNSNISKWNVSSVTDMGGMFSHATAFNQDLSKWNVSSVTNMGYMFSYATAFNHDLSKWNISSVTDMGGMFSYATKFNPKFKPVKRTK